MAFLKKLAMNASMIVLFAVAGIMLVPAALGYHRYIILTGSMTGTYDRGSLIFDKPQPTSSLKVGDPITYAPPPGASPNQPLVTHRIYKLVPGPKGQQAYITKGDANERPDNWKFVLPQAEQDVVKFHIPYVGFIFMALGIPWIRMLAIGLPALGMALWMIFGMWRDGGEVVRKRKEGLQAWGEDIAKKLPKLAPLAEAAAAAARATVRVPVSWPSPDAGALGRRLREGFVSPFVKPRSRRSEVRGTVALPADCVAPPRQATARTRERLPADWKLTVRPKS